MATITLRSTKGSPLTNSEVDSNFSNLNIDKYESGDNIVVGDLSSTGQLISSTSAAVSATGTVQGDATALTTAYNIVTSATEDQGVKLSSAVTGKQVTIVNATNAAIKLYPATGEVINSLSANAAKTVPAGATINLVCVSGTAWITLEQVVILDSSGIQIN